MGGTTDSNPTGQARTVRWILLLWCLTAVRLATGTEDGMTETNKDSLDVQILGPGYVTVGVPSSFECEANCNSKPCQYSMSIDKQASAGQGNVLALTLIQWVEALSLTCTAKDEQTTATKTVTKKLQVLAGPSNVSISGPDLMTPLASHGYTCHSYCRPSCEYTWRVDDGPWVAGQGNVIGVIPQHLDTAKTLMCRATNTVSGLFAAKIQDIAVSSGPSDVHIQGPSSMQLAVRTRFVCLADCMPACRYIWTLGDHTVRGSAIDVTVVQPRKTVSLKCEAQNTVTRKSDTVLLTVFLGDHSLATRAE
ncbi:unnamed protein product [Gadus morhua 'NCC']